MKTNDAKNDKQNKAQTKEAKFICECKQIRRSDHKSFAVPTKWISIEEMKAKYLDELI